MGRYVLLEFDDNDLAERFVEKTLGQAVEKSRKRGAKLVRVRGYFARPENYCECGPLSNLEQREQVVRGVRFGWWTHRNCRKAIRGAHTPRNLLDPAGTPARQRDAFLHINDRNIVANHPITLHEA